MKVKLFVYSSLGLLGVWLAAAYVHTVDVASYTGGKTSTVEHTETAPQLDSTEQAPLVAAQ